MTIPIQAPQIRPDIAQRTPSGEGEGLSPLIAALTRYKQSKLEEQRNAIEATRAQSEAGLQGAQADALHQRMQDEQEASDAWRKQIATAPAALQPFLKLVDASRGLPPELQHVVAGVAAQQIPGMTAANLKDLQGFLHLGLPLGVAAHLSGVAVRDIADKNPIDPTAIALPKNMLNWSYTPPGDVERDRSRDLRAQGMIVSQANKDDQVIQRDLRAQQQRIAQQVMQNRQPGRPLLTPPQFDPNDGEMVTQLHKYVTQHHYDTRLQLNRTNRDAAQARIKATALGTTPDAAPAADRISQILQLMQQPNDTTPQ